MSQVTHTGARRFEGIAFEFPSRSPFPQVHEHRAELVV